MKGDGTSGDLEDASSFFHGVAASEKAENFALPRSEGTDRGTEGFGRTGFGEFLPKARRNVLQTTKNIANGAEKFGARGFLEEIAGSPGTQSFQGNLGVIVDRNDEDFEIGVGGP